jgi:hypothetical protein
MTSQVSKKAKIAKYVVYVASILSTILLIVFPSFFPDQFKDRVLITFIMVSVIALLFAFEELKFVLQERDDEIALNFKRVDNYLLVNELYRLLRIVEEKGDEVFCKQTREAFIRLDSRLKKVERGELILDNAETAAIAINLADSVQQSLEATMLWGKTQFTGTAEDDYLGKLASAIKKRQVVIRRLFIIESGVESDPKFRERILRDQGNGVEVKYLHKNDWVQTEGVLHPVDFGIWDNKRVWTYSDNPDLTPSGRLATLYNNEGDVSYYRSVFVANWISGHNI